MKADTQKPLALAVNKAKGNADLQKPQKRSDKAPYLPPHLRVLLGEKSVGEHRDAIKPTPISTNSDRHDTNTTMKPSPATSVVADHPDTNTSLSSSKPVAGLPPHLRVMETVQKNDEAKVIGDIRVKLPPHLRVLNEHREGSSIIHPTIHGKSSPVPTEINATTSSEPVVHKMSSSGQLSGDENLHITQNVVMPASESLAAQSVVEDPKEDVARVRFESSPTDVLLDAPKETGKLVQELATNEPPLVDPGFTGANLLNRGKNKNASLLADNGLTKGLEDDKSVGSDGLTKSTVEEVKVDARGFEIPSKKAALRYQLVGWDGNWAPAPVEWDCRPAFNNNDRRHVRYMELWMHDRVVEALHRPLKLDTTLPGYTSGECPSSGRAGFLWRPYPVDWTTKRPDDPYTNVPEHLAQTSLSSSKAFCKVHYAEKKKRHEERRLAKEASLLEEANYVPPPNPHVPKANIYIRPAQHSDVEQITAIYNHYVKNSPVAGELENTPESEWRNRLRCAEDELLPFVVAVIKNAKNFNNAVGGRNGRRVVRRRAPIREVIVGFAYAEDYAGKNTAFQYTAEMQFFTHHEFLHMGIGKTLVDRMIVSMDQAYSSRNGAAFLADSPLYYEHGGRREIHRIMVNVGFYTKDPHAMKWIKDWLGKEWDFEHVGTLPGVGYKDNKQ